MGVKFGVVAVKQRVMGPGAEGGVRGMWLKIVRMGLWGGWGGDDGQGEDEDDVGGG